MEEQINESEEGIHVEIQTEKKQLLDKPRNDSFDLENWMAQLPRHLTRLPIIYLAIPGSHNSFSYSISPTSDVSPDSPKIVQRLGKWFKPLTNRIIYNWSLTQKENVTLQLINGIRYFDIRLVIRNNEILIAHGLYGGKIQAFLQEIDRFLNYHPSEVVVLDFQHFYEFQTSNHVELSQIIETTFGNKICHRKNSFRDVTLDGLWRDRKQVLIIYRNGVIMHNLLFWPSYSWITPWPNKLKVDELIEYLNHGIAHRKDDIGYVTQGVLTPDVKYVVFHICGSLKRMVVNNNKKIISWLETKSNGKHGINVVICDFVENDEFCQKVVKLNYKDYDLSVKGAWNPPDDVYNDVKQTSAY